MERKKDWQPSFITTNPLIPTGPAAHLFVAGAAVFEITVFEPPIQRVTLVGINLPPPGIFGPFSEYKATVLVSGDTATVAEFFLLPTIDSAVWAGTTLLDFGGTLPNLKAVVRPVLNGVRQGAVILKGTIFP